MLSITADSIAKTHVQARPSDALDGKDVALERQIVCVAFHRYAEFAIQDGSETNPGGDKRRSCRGYGFHH